ncbi:MAG TPA: ABC transporter substrate-binding protein [Clostridiales bacterium]|nr:ABC transporter substrate-binding protein [Clostridiales bacterium]
MKKTFALLILLTGFLFLAACSKAADQDQGGNLGAASSPTAGVTEGTPAPEELNVGILPAESAIPLILAKEKGFFEAAGVKVTLQAFSSPNDRNAAVQSKELDAVIGDVMTGAAFVDKGFPMKITSDISEDFKILSSPNSGITAMEQLGGKKISLVPNFILEYIMDQFAAEYGFDYEIVEIPSFSGRSEALMSDQIDGVVFTEPQAGMLAAQGAHLLGSSKEAGIKGGTLMFTEDAIAKHPAAVKAFYEAYNKAIDYMNETAASEYSDILSSYQFPEAIKDYLTGLNGTFQHAGAIDQEQFDHIIGWTKDKGLISKSYSYDELTDFSFLD